MIGFLESIDSKGSIDGIRVTEWNDPIVSWIDAEGNEGTSDVTKGECNFLAYQTGQQNGLIGVTMEPFGKDHGAAGGSYDTGRIIELFGRQSVDLTYEWISLRGQGRCRPHPAIPSTHWALSLLPPEILRYLVASTTQQSD